MLNYSPDEAGGGFGHESFNLNPGVRGRLHVCERGGGSHAQACYFSKKIGVYLWVWGCTWKIV